MIFITNSPEVSKQFANREVRMFVRQILKDLEDPYTLKNFLIEGHNKVYKKYLNELKKSYEVITRDDSDIRFPSYTSVKRCIDDKVFTVGDTVVDKVSNKLYAIKRMYSDATALLHIGLDVQPDGVTWRDLSQIK